MLESHRNHPVSQPSVNTSFSFMKMIADFVTTLTSDEVERGTASDGMVYFRKEEGLPKIDYPRNTEKHMSGNTVWLRARTVEKRSGVFEPSGPLGHMKSFIHENGKNDRKFLIEEILVRGSTDQNFWSGPGDYIIKTRSISSGSLLAHAKNAFRESESVDQITELSAGDLMYIRFVDDSHVYSISVRDSSRMVGNTATALCNITYLEGIEEITHEWIIRLPLNKNGEMFATARGKKIIALNKKISNIKLRKRRGSSTH